MDDWQTKLGEVLGSFDARSEPFTELDVMMAIRGLCPELRDIASLPAELRAEDLAFAFVENGSKAENEWGTYHGPMTSFSTPDRGVLEYPSLTQITPTILEQWTSRARTAKHPRLRFRYANLVWDFSGKVAGGPRHSPDVVRIAIDSAVSIAEEQLSPHQPEVHQKLARAHELAMAVNDTDRVQSVRKAVIEYEDRTAVDHLLGTWGYAFDLLVAADIKKKFAVSAEQQTKLVTELDTRMTRLADESDDQKFNPRAVELAALRLAREYRRHDDSFNVRRVLETYVRAHLRMAAVSPGAIAATSLQRVYETLLTFGQREGAELVAVYYREAAARMREEMKAVEHSDSISLEQIEEFLRPWTESELPELLARFAVRYTPDLGRAEDQVRELARAFPFSHLTRSSIVSREGRTVGRVGSVDEDLEGHIAQSISREMAFVAPFVRLVIERLVSAKGLNSERAIEFITPSPVFAPERRTFLEAGLKAYFVHDWVVAIHLLIPQIEQAIRRLVQFRGGSGLKLGRNGSMSLITLDELLRDERCLEVLGRSEVTYFRILLTDQRWWNVRNDVCHGLFEIDQFQPAVADRLFHVLICLGCLRAGTPPTANPRSSEEAADADANDVGGEQMDSTE